MKIKKLIAVVSVVSVLGAGAFASLTVSTPKKVEAATRWYYRGNDSSKSSSWASSSTHYFDGDSNAAAAPGAWTFISGEEFLIYGDSGSAWDDNKKYNVSTLAGTAAHFFSGDSRYTNIKYNGKAGASFNLTLNSGTLYIDYADNYDFYYVGSGSSWSDNTSKPIKVNGSATIFSFAANEEFKLRPSTHPDGDGAWAGALNVGNLNSSYYDIFTGSDNIVVNYTSSYKVKLVQSNHDLKIDIEANNPSIGTSYVLDMFNSRLQVTRHAHYFHNISQSQAIGTTFPGVEMETLSGRIYSFNYWTAFDSVIYTNDGSSQTANLTISNGGCFVLQEDWSGKWVTLEAAQFIDGYMHFNDIPTSSQGTTANCASNYSAAKGAYNNLSSNTIRQEVLSVPFVSERLAKWAAANHDELKLDGSLLSAHYNPNPISIISSNEDSNRIAVLIIVSLISLTAIGGYFFFRKRKEN